MPDFAVGQRTDRRRHEAAVGQVCTVGLGAGGTGPDSGISGAAGLCCRPGPLSPGQAMDRSHGILQTAGDLQLYWNNGMHDEGGGEYDGPPHTDWVRNISNNAIQDCS